MMTRDEALMMLGLDAAMPTHDEIRAGFTQRVKLAHPDTGGLTTEAARTIALLTTARNLLLRDATGQNIPCPQCRGRGTIRGKFGTLQCAACNGKGDKLP